MEDIDRHGIAKQIIIFNLDSNYTAKKASQLQHPNACREFINQVKSRYKSWVFMYKLCTPKKTKWDKSDPKV